MAIADANNKEEPNKLAVHQQSNGHPAKESLPLKDVNEENDEVKRFASLELFLFFFFFLFFYERNFATFACASLTFAISSRDFLGVIDQKKKNKI